MTCRNPHRTQTGIIPNWDGGSLLAALACLPAPLGSALLQPGSCQCCGCTEWAKARHRLAGRCGPRDTLFHGCQSPEPAPTSPTTSRSCPVNAASRSGRCCRPVRLTASTLSSPQTWTPSGVHWAAPACHEGSQMEDVPFDRNYRQTTDNFSG